MLLQYSAEHHNGTPSTIKGLRIPRKSKHRAFLKSENIPSDVCPSLRSAMGSLAAEVAGDFRGAPRRPKFLCLHGFRTSGEIMRTQVVGKWPEEVTARLDLVFPDAPFPAEGKSDVDGIFPPPYYEWFQFDKVPPLPFPPNPSSISFFPPRFIPIVLSRVSWSTGTWMNASRILRT